MHRLPALIALAMLSMVVACADETPNEIQSKQSGGPALLPATAAPPDGEAMTADGHLKIQVPVGVVGEHNYWIYLNGRIASAPQSDEEINNDSYPFHSNSFGGGWNLQDEDYTIFLRMSHETWTESLDQYLKSGDREHVFKLIDLTLPPGNYRVELVFRSDLNGNSSSFPFVVSHPYDIEVQSEKVTEIYPGVPDSFEQHGTPRAAVPTASLCVFWGGAAYLAAIGQTPRPPDVSQWKEVLDEFRADPVVKALQEASATYSPPEKVVSLNLPQDLGGARDFDGTQISIIATEIANRYEPLLPSKEEVPRCIREFPQFSPPYNAYLQLINSVEGELESFRQLGRDLSGQ